jgi:hypothetical protein
LYTLLSVKFAGAGRNLCSTEVRTVQTTNSAQPQSTL